MSEMTPKSTFPHVWGVIRHVFNPAILDETQIHEKYSNIDSEQVLKASRV